MAMITTASINSMNELSLRGTQPGARATPAQTEPGHEFMSMLSQMATQAAETLRQGETAALSGMTGGLPLQTVVERVMAAERTLQSAIAVRDKAVSAYLEVSRMQI